MSLPPVLLRPGEGDLLDYKDGDSTMILAPGDATGGAFTIVEHSLSPGAEGPPPHYHEYMCDAFYVLEGTLTLLVGDRAVDAPAGSLACFPPGNIHTFSNPSDDPVRILNVNAPGGWDRVLRAVVASAATSGPVESSEVGDIASERDMVVVER